MDGNVDTYLRKSSKVGHPQPLAAVFDDTPSRPVHLVRIVAWDIPSHSKLVHLGGLLRSLRPRRELPVSGLRYRLHVWDEQNLRVDARLGLYGDYGQTPRQMLWTAQPLREAAKLAQRSVLSWLNEDVAPVVAGVDEAAALLDEVLVLARAEKLFRVTERKASVFEWQVSRRGTVEVDRGRNGFGYPDLADFVARLLEGNEVLAGCGALRRIASRRLDSNQSSLMTEPIAAGTEQFSIVVTVCVSSFPGRAKPIVDFAFSKRVWTTKIKAFTTSKTLSAYAFPTGATYALQFQLRREKGGGFRADEGFDIIARRYGLQLQETGARVADGGASNASCQILLGLKHGAMLRTKVKSGVPCIDKLEAFEAICKILGPSGFLPWVGLRQIDVARQPSTLGNAWINRHKNRDTKARFRAWQTQELAAITKHYGEHHHVVIGYYKANRADAVKARSILEELLEGKVKVELIRLPEGVHGARKALEAPEKTGVERAALRVEAWRQFLEQLRKYRQAVEPAAGQVHGVIVLAPSFFDAPDDRVNKRVGKVTIASKADLPVQYLQPAEVAGANMTARAKDTDRHFEDRVVMAWRDLAWKSMGCLQSTATGARTEKPRGTKDPDKVMAIGIVRRNRSWSMRNESSFIPYAIELDVKSGACRARIAHWSDKAFETTDMLALPKLLAHLARIGPSPLADGDEKQTQREARAQDFFLSAIAAFARAAEQPLLLIDANTCRSVWPWLRDSQLDGRNVSFGARTHVEQDWGKLRIVRVRTDNSPKVLYDKYFEAMRDDGQVAFQYRAPTYAEMKLFKLTDSSQDVYLSFGSIIRKNKRGKSCHRSGPVLVSPKKEEPPNSTVKTPARYARVEAPPYVGAWSTPVGIDLTVVRFPRGESADEIAAIVQQLCVGYGHFEQRTSLPAPLFFGSVLREYVADYNFVDEDEDGESTEDE